MVTTHLREDVMASIFRVHPRRRPSRSRRALALPVTFLILLVTTLGLVSITYYFSVQNLAVQSEGLKVSTAQQDFVSLNNLVLSTLGQPGSSNTIDLSDSGGTTNIQPSSNILNLMVTDNSGIDQTVFNSAIGKVSYALPSVGSLQSGLYLAGDSEPITNLTGASPSQLYMTDGFPGPMIQLQYRPTVAYASAGVQNGEAVNNIRIYVVNLNSSVSLSLGGDLPLQISNVNTQLTSETFHVSNQPENFVITSILNGAVGSVSVPISTASQGAVINLEIVISNVSIQRLIQ